MGFVAKLNHALENERNRKLRMDIWHKLERLSEMCDNMVAISPNRQWRAGDPMGAPGTVRWDVIKPGELAEADSYEDIVIASSGVSPFDAVDEAMAVMRARLDATEVPG